MRYELFSDTIKIGDRSWDIRVMGGDRFGGGKSPPLAPDTIISTTDHVYAEDSCVPITISHNIQGAFNPHAEHEEYIQQAMDLMQLIIDNDSNIREPQDWDVSIGRLDRTGVFQFHGVPLPTFQQFWRFPLEIEKITMRVVPNTGMIGFSYQGDALSSFDSYIEWRGLYDDLRGANKILPWLKKYCRGRLYMFSDFESMFEYPEDEFRYVAEFEL